MAGNADARIEAIVLLMASKECGVHVRSQDGAIRCDLLIKIRIALLGNDQEVPPASMQDDGRVWSLYQRRFCQR